MYLFFTAPFRISFSLSQCLPFQFSLTLPFYCLRVQLVFSHPPITSLHLISAIFKIFFPHHHTRGRAKPETSYYWNFFFKFTYFALGSLIFQIIVSLYVTSATQNTSTSFWPEFIMNIHKRVWKYKCWHQWEILWSVQLTTKNSKTSTSSQF